MVCSVSEMPRAFAPDFATGKPIEQAAIYLFQRPVAALHTRVGNGALFALWEGPTPPKGLNANPDD